MLQNEYHMFILKRVILNYDSKLNTMKCGSDYSHGIRCVEHETIFNYFTIFSNGGCTAWNIKFELNIHE